jgi:hypothetical protein
VLTRLKKPVRERYPGDVREILEGLTPLEKLWLYEDGTAPDRLSLAQARELKKWLPALYQESDSYPNYEGRTGASAREIKTALFNAAQNPDRPCLSPLAVLEELTALTKDKSVYEFFRKRWWTATTTTRSSSALWSSSISRRWTPRCANRCGWSRTSSTPRSSRPMCSTSGTG